jgi:hypothetical protein
MAQNKVLILTLSVTIATAVVEALVELGRNQLTTDLYRIEGAEAVVRRRSRRDRLRLQNTARLQQTPKLNHRLPVRKRSARHN